MSDPFSRSIRICIHHIFQTHSMRDKSRLEATVIGLVPDPDPTCES